MNTLYLDRNENQYGPAPECYEILKNSSFEEMSLYSRDYTRGVKSVLSERLAAAHGISESQLLLGYGSEDMLKQVVHCYLHSGETILLPRQSWWYYQKVAGEVAGKEVHYSLREDGRRFSYDIPSLLGLYDRHAPRVILLASPNNPTGNSLDRLGLEQLLDHCRNSVVVLDEAYAGFVANDDGQTGELLRRHTRLIILRTFSKYYALAGIRTGYACAGKDLDALVRFSARYLGYNRLSERIALAALDAAGYYQRMAATMAEDRSRYAVEFASRPGFTAYESDANFMLVRYPPSIKDLLGSGLEQRGIVLKFMSDPGFEDCIRITIGTREQNDRVIDAFREIIPAPGNP
jgi:histidinol-phosphate aminotransferase